MMYMMHDGAGPEEQQVFLKEDITYIFLYRKREKVTLAIFLMIE